MLLFAVAILLNSGLLFWLEPLFAKLVLPMLGGAPAVWNTCLVFYQITLLAGYTWAHLGDRLGRRTHAGIHLALSAIALALLPFAVPRWLLPPSYDAPVSWLLVVLAASVGLPFFLIAANGPLLQRWFTVSGTRGSHDPYFLYAASNLGSAAALLLFPAVLERSLTLTVQTRAWQMTYAIIALLVAACGWVALRMRPEVTAPAVSGGTETDVNQPKEVTARRRARWVALAAVPSSLMVGVTTYISTEIAPIPLVWIVPLALYLGTLILAFAAVPGLNALVRTAFAERLTTRSALATGAAVLAALVVCLLAMLVAGTRAAIITAHLLLFFGAALLCHAQLADDRPQAERLTEFYFWLGVGGALGGSFNALLGPWLFRSVLEYPLALAAVCMLLPLPANRVMRYGWGDVLWPAAVGVGAALVPWVLPLVRASLPFSPRLLLAIPALACLGFSGRPLRFGMGLVAIILASTVYPSEIGTVELAERNFFGVHRVLRDDAGGFRWLTHGSTVHGGQRLSERDNPVPLTYYHPAGPLGDLFREFAPSRPHAKVAVIGLGAGSMLYYGSVGQAWTFYEIDEAVIQIARNPRYFTYLERARPSVRMVLGDARLMLTRDTAERYDLIVLDAFGSDAVPVHLLTREAMQLYRSRLAPRGLLAMHLSNRFLDLGPVAAGLAAASGLAATQRVDLQADASIGKYRSQWVVFADDGSAFGALARNPLWLPLRDASGRRVWSDDYSSILPVLRRGGSELSR